jgi:hypothetical protein
MDRCMAGRAGRLVQDALDQGQHLPRSLGLEDQLVAAQGQRAFPHFRGGAGGDAHDGDIPGVGVLLDPAQQLEAVHFGEVEVQEDNGREALGEGRVCFRDGGRLHHPEAAVTEDRAQDVPARGAVVNDQRASSARLHVTPVLDHVLARLQDGGPRRSVAVDRDVQRRGGRPYAGRP